MQLSAQLPTFVRGVYFEGYHPADKPLTYRDQETFLNHVENELQQSRPANPQGAVKAVFTVLDRIGARYTVYTPGTGRALM